MRCGTGTVFGLVVPFPNAIGIHNDPNLTFSNVLFEGAGEGEEGDLNF